MYTVSLLFGMVDGPLLRTMVRTVTRAPNSLYATSEATLWLGRREGGREGGRRERAGWAECRKREGGRNDENIGETV